jgi:hypothetical protein
MQELTNSKIKSKKDIQLNRGADEAPLDKENRKKKGPELPSIKLIQKSNLSSMGMPSNYGLSPKNLRDSSVFNGPYTNNSMSNMVISNANGK